MTHLLYPPDALESEARPVLVWVALGNVGKSVRQTEGNPVQPLALAARRGLIFFLITNPTFDVQKKWYRDLIEVSVSTTYLANATHDRHRNASAPVMVPAARSRVR